MLRTEGPGWCDGDADAVRGCSTARARGDGRRCWTCPARDLEIDMRTWKGRVFRRAVELDFSLRNGRTVEAESLPADLEACLRIVVEARLKREQEVQDEAMRAAKRGGR